jgi:SET domain-containing protein
MRERTDEFSFVLKVSRVDRAGIGVFALHDIAKGAWLEVFPRAYRSRRFRAHELPPELRSYCTAKDGGVYACPQQFNRMYIGWYMNHSPRPNADWDDDLGGYVAIADIASGDEIFIDYNLFEEPDDAKEPYYRQSSRKEFQNESTGE